MRLYVRGSNKGCEVWGCIVVLGCEVWGCKVVLG